MSIQETPKTFKTNYELEILDGKLPLPQQIIDLSNGNCKVSQEPEMKAMFKSLWLNFLMSKSSVSVPRWSNKFSDKKVFVNFTKHLSRAGWIVSEVIPARNWGEIRLNEDKLLKLVSSDQLNEVRRRFKMKKYQLECKTNNQYSDLTRINGKKQDTGLKRDGFALAGNSPFMYDTQAIIDNREAIELNLTKSMDKLGLKFEVFKDQTDYSTISKLVLNHIIENPDEVYATGANTNDSRGRAISDVLSKVFNPISNKDARACMKLYTTNPMKPELVKHAYLFIAELLGLKPSTLLEKEEQGKQAYLDNQLHELDLSDEEDRKELHENIWISRLYDEIERYANHMENNPEDEFYFLVPIEKDFTASILAIEGALLNHLPFLEGTNCTGNKLNDIWTKGTIPRKWFKDYWTPALYGSSKSVKDIWKSKKHPFSKEQLSEMNNEVRNGDFAVAIAFKDFIIKNVKPKETMKVKVWNEVFTIKCNKFKIKGERAVRYRAFDSESNLVQTIVHMETTKEPNLEQFRLFFVTLLVHNLDSQIANSVCFEVMNKPAGFVVPIHDAFIAGLTDIDTVELEACSQMDKIYSKREIILKDYFHSIGIDSKSAIHWKQVTKLTKPAVDFKCKATCLK